MARTVLIGAAAGVLVLFAACSGTSTVPGATAQNPQPQATTTTATPTPSKVAEKASACSGSAFASVSQQQSAKAKQYEDKVKSGPLYKDLVQRFGKPTACSGAVNDTTLSLEFGFGERANLKTKTDPSIEYNEQTAEAPDVTDDAAMKLLKDAERDSFGKDGCGINWSAAQKDKSETGAPQQIYRGETCNCQGRIERRDKSVVLTLSSAC